MNRRQNLCKGMVLYYIQLLTWVKSNIDYVGPRGTKYCPMRIYIFLFAQINVEIFLKQCQYSRGVEFKNITISPFLSIGEHVGYKARDFMVENNLILWIKFKIRLRDTQTVR